MERKAKPKELTEEDIDSIALPLMRQRFMMWYDRKAVIAFNKGPEIRYGKANSRSTKTNTR